MQFRPGEDAASLRIDYTKPISIMIHEGMKPQDIVRIEFTDASGNRASASVYNRIDTALEMEYYETGGILNYVIRKMMG